jgi:5-hydroxyisourate hydrolase
MGISTHVLDTARGQSADGLSVVLDRRGAAGFERVAASTTDAGGRARLIEAPPPPGVYRLGFASGAYFDRLGVETFYPEIRVEFEVRTGDSDHYHVPLLLSPFGYSTYRGA